jgi:hypothetical protein
MVAAAPCPEPPLACLSHRPECEPKPVRFLRFLLKVAAPEFDEINE